MKLFRDIAVETGSKCNRGCVFCPNHGNDRPDEYMPMELLEKIADELHDLKYAGRLENFNYNEPLRDPRALDILAMWHERVPRAYILVSTNGDYIKTKAQLKAVFEASGGSVLVDIYNATDGTDHPEKGLVKARNRALLFETWMDELGVNRDLSPYHKAPRGVMVGRVSHKYGIVTGSKKLGPFQLQNRSGNIDWFKDAVKEPLNKVCVRPFRDFLMNWKGDHILCVNDYHGVTALGNIKDKTLVQLWEGKKIMEYRRKLQDGNRHMPLCNKCDYFGGAFKHELVRV